MGNWLLVLMLIPVVILVIGATVAGAVLSRRGRSGPALAEVLEALRERFHGELRSVGGSPTLFLNRPGFEVAVDMSGPETARGSVNFSAKPDGAFAGHLHVSPEGVGMSVSRFFGDEDIRIGDSQFDALYEIRGEPEEFVRNVLSADIRSLIRAVGRRGHLALTVSPKVLNLRLTTTLFSTGTLQDLLDTLISCGLQIAEALPRKASTKEVVFVETEGAVEETACQVCGTALSGKIVECTKCATLHHADCWNFNERCSTYACGSLSCRDAKLRG